MLFWMSLTTIELTPSKMFERLLPQPITGKQSKQMVHSYVSFFNLCIWFDWDKSSVCLETTVTRDIQSLPSDIYSFEENRQPLW